LAKSARDEGAVVPWQDLCRSASEMVEGRSSPAFASTLARALAPSLSSGIVVGAPRVVPREGSSGAEFRDESVSRLFKPPAVSPEALQAVTKE